MKINKCTGKPSCKSESEINEKIKKMTPFIFTAEKEYSSNNYDDFPPLEYQP